MLRAQLATLKIHSGLDARFGSSYGIDYACIPTYIHFYSILIDTFPCGGDTPLSNPRAGSAPPSPGFVYFTTCYDVR